MPKTKIQKLFDKAWKLQSEYIRRRDSDWRGLARCITCSLTKNWKEMHAGHYRHRFLDFDEQNVNAQCSGCNTYRSGNLDIYTLALTRKYGPNVIEEIDSRRTIQLQKKEKTGKAYTAEELEQIISDLKEKIKKLE